MIKLRGFDEAGQSSLPAGGYVGRITNARIDKFQDGTPALFVDADIAEGEFTGHFARETAKFKKSRSDVVWSSNGTIKVRLFADDNGNVHWQLANFLKAVAASNSNFVVEDDDDFDERSLIGQSCGLVVGLKASDKLKNDGTPYTNAYISYAISVDKIESGDFKIPDIKPAKKSSATTSTTSTASSSSDDFDRADLEDPPF